MATFVAATALLGIAIAGVRMPSGETQTLHASEPGQAVGKRDKVADRGKAPGAEAKPHKQPLTLDELRPLVVDQIRSIRSLYVAYSRTDPAEFEGKSHDHVWAEQGFKMFKCDMPGKSIVPYASSFDGKQTYIGAFQGDKPVRAYVEDELSPTFHESLRGNALLGWLHFLGQRESIVGVLRAPQATLVKAATADGAPGPKIEVKNYAQPASQSLLDVTIVLDREHGYLPRSIAFHSVANPLWQFAYEVDEFQQVRDGATGANRWFPGRARYVQRTDDRGEQVWNEKVTKLQINDVLPDDLFVLAPTSPAAILGQERQALTEFEKVYHLDPDQLVRRVKPPYLPGRMVNLKNWWADAFSQSPSLYETSGTFLPMVYPERNGQLGQPGFRFTTGVDQAGIPASELLNAVGAALKLSLREVEDPDKVLEPMVEGDFVIRADAPRPRSSPHWDNCSRASVVSRAHWNCATSSTRSSPLAARSVRRLPLSLKLLLNSTLRSLNPAREKTNREPLATFYRLSAGLLIPSAALSTKSRILRIGKQRSRGAGLPALRRPTTRHWEKRTPARRSITWSSRRG